MLRLPPNMISVHRIHLLVALAYVGSLACAGRMPAICQHTGEVMPVRTAAELEPGRPLYQAVSLMTEETSLISGKWIDRVLAHKPDEPSELGLARLVLPVPVRNWKACQTERQGAAAAIEWQMMAAWNKSEGGDSMWVGQGVGGRAHLECIARHPDNLGRSAHWHVEPLAALPGEGGPGLVIVERYDNGGAERLMFYAPTSDVVLGIAHNDDTSTPLARARVLAQRHLAGQPPKPGVLALLRHLDLDHDAWWLFHQHWEAPEEANTLASVRTHARHFDWHGGEEIRACATYVFGKAADRPRAQHSADQMLDLMASWSKQRWLDQRGSDHVEGLFKGARIVGHDNVLAAQATVLLHEFAIFERVIESAIYNASHTRDEDQLRHENIDDLRHQFQPRPGTDYE